jgi:hypothetical protein
MGVQAQAPLNDITTQNANETKNTLWAARPAPQLLLGDAHCDGRRAPEPNPKVGESPLSLGSGVHTPTHVGGWVAVGLGNDSGFTN